MKQKKVLNNPENFKNLWLKNKNFLNSQNYILGNSEKKKVLTSFLGTKTLKKILSYIGIIMSIIFIWEWISFIEFIPLSIWFICLWIISVIYFDNYKINSIKEYFISKKENNLNKIFFTSFYTFFTCMVLLAFFDYAEDFDIINSIYCLIILILCIYLFKKKKILIRVNYINIILSPLVIPLWVITYIFTYIFLSFQKFEVIKNNPIKQSILNFIETNWIFSNWFYKISKK